MSLVPLYGGLSDFGYYFADISIGTPGQRMSVILDTGSEGLSVTCSTCGDRCGTKHMDPFYNPAASTTFVDENQCFSRHSIRAPICTYEKKYLEGSSLTGRFATDTVAIGTVKKQIQFGCIESETKLFLEQRANGILGLAPTAKTALFTQGEEITGFSVCLSSEGGDLQFLSTKDLMVDAKNIPLKYVDNHYVVEPSQVVVDGTTEPDGSSILGDQVLFDTGSTVTYLNDEFFRKISKTVSERAKQAGLQLDYIANRDPTLCWVSSRESSASNFTLSDFTHLLPKIIFSFTSDDNSQVSLSFHDYAFADVNNRFCLRIASNGSLRRTDLGAPFMIGKKIVFTPKLGKVWFIDAANCTERRIEDREPVVAVPGQLTATINSSPSSNVTEFFVVFIFLLLITASVLIYIVRKSVYLPAQHKELKEFEIGSPNSQLE